MSAMDNYCVNALRVIAAEEITKAKSGHPGIALGAAPILHTLFTKHLNINYEDEKWYNRDRFVLSAGHGSALLYLMLSLSGFGITMDDIKEFRQKGSKTPGHPEYKHVPGVEMTTGPLGQGFATAVGMAIAENFLAAKFNRPDYHVVDHYTYVLVGDGDLEEGVAMEAASLAGHLGVKKLIALYDSNDIQLDSEVADTNNDDVKEKFESMGWDYFNVKDGNDCEYIDRIIKLAKNSSRPAIIEIKTIIGHGAPNSGEKSVHGKPLSKEDIEELKKNLGANINDFDFPDVVVSYYKKTVIDRGYQACSEWNEMLRYYAQDYSEEHKLFIKFMYDEFEDVDLSKLHKYEAGSNKSTRQMMGEIFQDISIQLPNLIGGSADLSSSTMIKGADGSLSASNPTGRNILYGVREHAMGAIANGLTLYGGLRGVASGFFVFSDYLRPAIRLAAIMKIPSIFLFSHDSVCVGEDGPTHQPVEQLTSFRCMPNVNIARPADAHELEAMMVNAVKNNDYPSVIVSTRQGVTNLDSTDENKALLGAYKVFEANKNSKFAIISCGSELELAVNVAKKYKEEGINVDVISMPSMFLFERQPEKYKAELLNKYDVKYAIEMGSTMSWYKYAHYVYGIDEFGASMPLKEIYEYYGFTVDNIYNETKKVFK